MRPKPSPYVGQMRPEVNKVVKTIARSNWETVQVHGAEAARRFRVSTQAPAQPTYYTNRAGREIRLGKLKVRFIHTNNLRKLQHAGKRPGEALSALWYLGKAHVNADVIERIRRNLSPAEFKQLEQSRMPAWMRRAFEQYRQSAAHA